MESCRVRGLLRVASYARVRGLQQKPPLTPLSHLVAPGSQGWLQARGRQGEAEGKGEGKGEGEVV
jgi:hypothetical protein